MVSGSPAMSGAASAISAIKPSMTPPAKRVGLRRMKRRRPDLCRTGASVLATGPAMVSAAAFMSTLAPPRLSSRGRRSRSPGSKNTGSAHGGTPGVHGFRARTFGPPRNDSGTETSASIPDPRIEEGVGEVAHEVDDHVDAREQQDHPLDDRVVALRDRVDDEAADPRDVEDRLGDDDAADKKRDADADHGHDRDAGVLQRVLQQHRPGRDALGLGGADVIL